MKKALPEAALKLEDGSVETDQDSTGRLVILRHSIYGTHNATKTSGGASLLRI